VDRKAIERFKRSLQARHRELRQGLAQTHKELRTAQHEYGKDEGDRANTSLARELDLGQKSRDRALLSAVDAALKRISAGTFGQCLNCEQEINAKRLEAIPWVRYCITCQELIDSAKWKAGKVVSWGGAANEDTANASITLTMAKLLFIAEVADRPVGLCQHRQYQAPQKEIYHPRTRTNGGQ
jgi:DnaK suppressor protein